MKAKLLLLVFLIVAPGALHAQGLFQGFGFPVPVVSTGQTEVIGLILASMTLGPAATDTLVIDVSPLQITNANASDIVVTATGLSVGATTIDTTNNLVEIPVQPVNTSSGSVRIQGIRVAVAGANISLFNARLYWMNSQNAFIAGGSVPVISSVQSGLVAQVIAGASTGVTAQGYSSNPTLQLTEGFPGAFTSSLQYGQTGSTQVQITLSDFPAGGQLTLPAVVTANETAATLAIIGGQSVNLSGNATLTYVYSSAGNSSDVAETFNMNLSLALPVTGGSLQPKIQVTLAPIGTAIPTAALPSTAIPRYTENEITVTPAAPLTVSKILYWTGINPALQNQVQITNPNLQISNLTIDALDSTGKQIAGLGVTNPVKLKLAAGQSLISAVADLFGAVAGISTIRIQSTTPDLLAAATASGSGVNQVVPFVSPVTTLLLPVVNGSAKLQLMNPSTSPVTGILTLFNPAGQVVSTAPVNIAGFASTVLTLDAIFSAPPQAGYATAVFSGAVVADELVGQSRLQALQPPASAPSVFVPFVVGGSSFSTNLNLINPANQTLTLNAQLFGSSGSLLATQAITMQPGQQMTESVQQMFSQSPDAGYVVFGLPQSGKAFFISYPLIAGQAELVTSRGASAAIPLSDSPSSSAFVLPVANSASGYEGFAFLNPTGSQVAVSVQALNVDGSVAATASVTLNAGQLGAQLTSQLFSAGVPATATIRVTSSAPIVVTAISGSNDLNSMIALSVM